MNIILKLHKNNVNSINSSRLSYQWYRSRYYSHSHYIMKEKVNKVIYKEQYERMEPLDHVLLRPGMYVGQMEASSVETW